MNSESRKLILEKRHYNAIFRSIYCRTAKIGVAKYCCSTCDKKAYIYRSCKNRFCARCGNQDTKKWAKNSLSKLCNIKHHHVVFTLPQPFRHIAKLNEKLFYNILFSATSKGIMDWFKKKHNIKPGIISVLHTAGSDLKYHPHIHMIVTAGGLNLDSSKIIEFKKDFLTRQRFLAEKFKQYFFIELFKNLTKGKLKLSRRFQNEPEKFKRWARAIRDKHWIASIQKPLSNIENIVGYVGRYTKRACLSEYKILSVNNDTIKILFNDYKNTPKGTKTLQSIKSFTHSQFFDELLQHVPLEKFRMVRYFGIYTSHYKKIIENHTRIQNEQTHKLIPQGDFAQFRLLEMLNGKPDPLRCSNCDTVMAFDEVLYIDSKFINDP